VPEISRSRRPSKGQRGHKKAGCPFEGQPKAGGWQLGEGGPGPYRGGGAADRYGSALGMPPGAPAAGF